MKYRFYDEFGYIDRPDEDDDLLWVTGNPFDFIESHERLYEMLRRAAMPERMDVRPSVPKVYVKAFTEEKK